MLQMTVTFWVAAHTTGTIWRKILLDSKQWLFYTTWKALTGSWLSQRNISSDNWRATSRHFDARNSLLPATSSVSVWLEGETTLLPLPKCVRMFLTLTLKNSEGADTCVWFPQVRGPGFVAATVGSPLLHWQRVSHPPLRLLGVRVATLAAHHTRLALTRGFRLVTCLPLPHKLLPLLRRHLFPRFPSLLLPLLPLFQRLFVQREAGHSCLWLREGNGSLVVRVVGCVDVRE